jgi:hypothetical protein
MVIPVVIELAGIVTAVLTVFDAIVTAVVIGQLDGGVQTTTTEPTPNGIAYLGSP